MGQSEKKKLKAQAKALKKKLKAEAKAAKAAPTGGQEASPVVRAAEMVRGIMFLILAVSLVVAMILSDQGYIVTLEDIFNSLVAAWIGKAVLLIIAAAFFVIGLKHLRAVR